MALEWQKSSIHENNLKVESSAKAYTTKKGRRAKDSTRIASRREGREKGERRAAGVASRFGRVMSKASMQSAETKVEMLGMDARHQNRSPCVREGGESESRYHSIVMIRHGSPMRHVSSHVRCR